MNPPSPSGRENLFSSRSNFCDSNCQNSRSRFESNLRMTTRVCRELKAKEQARIYTSMYFCVPSFRSFFLPVSQLSKQRRRIGRTKTNDEYVSSIRRYAFNISKGITKIRILVSVRIDRNRVWRNRGDPGWRGTKDWIEGKELRGWRGHRGSTSPLRSCQRTFHMKINQINRLFQTFA